MPAACRGSCIDNGPDRFLTTHQLTGAVARFILPPGDGRATVGAQGALACLATSNAAGTYTLDLCADAACTQQIAPLQSGTFGVTASAVDPVTHRLQFTRPQLVPDATSSIVTTIATASAVLALTVSVATIPSAIHAGPTMLCFVVAADTAATIDALYLPTSPLPVW
jgi:hypothetical protein